MNEEQAVVTLLTEIRDLQKAHIENYKDALENQQKAIVLQAEAVRRQKWAMMAGLIIVVVGLLGLIVPAFLHH